MRILFWQNFPNHLQSAVFRSLAERADLEVYWVVESDIDDHRKNMGWSMPELGQIKLVVTPSAETVQDLINDNPTDSVHIFSPNRSLPIVSASFQLALETDTLVGLMTEAGKLRGIRGVARLVRGRFQSIRFQNRINFILAIGSNGVAWYRLCGYPDNKIYPYGYFVEPSPSLEIAAHKAITHSFNMFFLGQLVQRKGVDLLIRALHNLEIKTWRLTIIGDGPRRKYLEAMVNSSGLTGKIDFKGALSNEEAMIKLTDSDLLILPSRWDGWGVVVNEALMRGVPVICSDKCGATDLLRDPIRGDVFVSGSLDDLASKLYNRVRKGKLDSQNRFKIRKWSLAISAQTAAKYVIDIINFVKAGGVQPPAPWLIN